MSSIILMISCMTGCSGITDAERYAERLENVEKVDSEVLVELKEVCKTALEEEIDVKELFIYTNYIDGYYVQAHVLTTNEEYLVYSIESSYIGILGASLKNGVSMDNVLDQIITSDPKVDNENKVIDIG